MTTTPLETEGSRNPVPRYQTIDDEFYDPRNRDQQVRQAARFQADMLITIAQIKASRGGPGDMAEMLGLAD